MSSSSASERDRMLDGFAGYLRRERGVSTLTVDLYVAAMARPRAARHHPHLPARRHEPEGTRRRPRHAARHHRGPLPATRPAPRLPRQPLIVPTSPPTISPPLRPDDAHLGTITTSEQSVICAHRLPWETGLRGEQNVAARNGRKPYGAKSDVPMSWRRARRPLEMSPISCATSAPHGSGIACLLTTSNHGSSGGRSSYMRAHWRSAPGWHGPPGRTQRSGPSDDSTYAEHCSPRMRSPRGSLGTTIVRGPRTGPSPSSSRPTSTRATALQPTCTSRAFRTSSSPGSNGQPRTGSEGDGQCPEAPSSPRSLN
jgi:hypothetical protein